MATLASGTAADQKGITDYSAHKQLTQYSYLEQLADLPVTVLHHICLATSAFQTDLGIKSNISNLHPCFSTVECKKTTPDQQSFDHSQQSLGLNSLFSYEEGQEYINQAKLLPICKYSVYHQLLAEYDFTDYNASVTIGGMLYDLHQRAQKEDQTAKLVLEFLKKPHPNVAFPEENRNNFFLFRWMQNLQQRLFLPSKEPSFSEKLKAITLKMSLEKNAAKDSKLNRLDSLKKENYLYKKNYTFTLYKTDNNGETVFQTFDSLIQLDEEVKKAIHENCPESNLEHTNSSSFFTLNKKIVPGIIAGLIFSSSIIGAASFLESSSAGSRYAMSREPCWLDDERCTLVNNDDFISAITNNTYGGFGLTEDVYLSSTIYPNCSDPFMGDIDTKGYVIHPPENGPVFGCIDQVHFYGDINLCLSQNSNPAFADNILDGNNLDISQARNDCDTHRPAIGNIIGNANNIHFDAYNRKIKLPNGTGIVANKLSGDHNTIKFLRSQPYDSSVVYLLDGNKNKIHQKKVNATMHVDDNIPHLENLAAHIISGNGSTIILENVNATLITPDLNYSMNKTSSNPQTSVDIILYNFLAKVIPPEGAIRLTAFKENSTERSVVVNNGRPEIFQEGQWKIQHENTFKQEEADEFCVILGHEKAQNNETRLALKQLFESDQENKNTAYSDTSRHKYFLSCCDETTDDFTTVSVNGTTDPNWNNTDSSHLADKIALPKIALKFCPESNKTPGKINFISGELNQDIMCEPSECPVTLWDADATKTSDDFKKECEKQKIHTTKQQGMLAVHKILCPGSYHYDCVTLNEYQIAWIRRKNYELILSRQIYPYNTDASNLKKPIMIEIYKDNSKQEIYYFTTNNCSFTNTQHFDMLVYEDYLIGACVDDINRRGLQLFWVSLQDDKQIFHEKSYLSDQDYDLVVLEHDGVFLTHKNSKIFDYFQLNINKSNNDIEINHLHKKITAPSSNDRSLNIVSAAVKDKYLYIAFIRYGKHPGTHFEMSRYNTLTESWDTNLCKIPNYNRHIDYTQDTLEITDEAIQFLRVSRAGKQKLYSYFARHPITLCLIDENEAIPAENTNLSTIIYIPRNNTNEKTQDIPTEPPWFIPLSFTVIGAISAYSSVFIYKKYKNHRTKKNTKKYSINIEAQENGETVPMTNNHISTSLSLDESTEAHASVNANVDAAQSRSFMSDYK